MRDALDSGAPIEEIFVSADSDVLATISPPADVPTTEVGPRVIKALSESVTPQGVVAVAALAETPLEVLADADLVLVLDGVADPGNAGTLIRTAAAAGARAMVFTSGSVDPYSGKCVRAAAAAMFTLDLVVDVDFEDVARTARATGLTFLGLDPSGTPYFDVDLKSRCALVAGSEGWGIAPEHHAYLDGTVGIPMPGGIESLNVASATAIVLFEAVRQRLSSAGEEVEGG